MGYMRHHAIVVTGWRDDLLSVRDKVAGIVTATDNCMIRVTPLTDKATNSYASFLVAPDGSKEGWDTSDAGDEARAEIIKYLDSLRHEDGSTSVDWVEVQFGDDDRETIIVNHSDEESRWKAANTESTAAEN